MDHSTPEERWGLGFTVPPSVAPMTTAVTNVMMATTVITVIGIARSTLPIAMNVCAPLWPAVMLRNVNQGLQKIVLAVVA